MITDERYRKIMLELGMPNSRSLLLSLQQIANEVAQETKVRVAELETQLDELRKQEPVATVLHDAPEGKSQRIDTELPAGTKLYAAPVPPEESKS